MAPESIHQLLLERGFRNAGWPRPGHRWSVVGDLDGGFGLVIGCVESAASPHGYYLLSPHETARDWLSRELAKEGATVEVRGAIERAPLLALSAILSTVMAVGWALERIS